MVSSSKSDVAGQSLSAAGTAPLSFGLVGLGGYGSHVLRCLKESSAAPNAPVRLAAVCDPDEERFSLQMAELRAAGLSIYTRIEDFMRDPQVQAVWLPVPITLHRKFTLAALDHGKAVMCEKPAAATVDEVDQMIADRDRSGRVVAIGFQDIYDPLVQDAKRRILAGELGKITGASVWGVWPRDSSYYGRNTWAGSLRRDGQWVLDSPASNAMAHFITLLLFLMGPTQETAAVPISVEAELYRVNPIENYDTCAMRITVEGGNSLLVLLTHAGKVECKVDTVLTGNAGSLTFSGRESLTWSSPASQQTHVRAEPFTPMIRSFADTVRKIPAPPLATLEIARQHTVIINGASQAASIYTIAPEYVKLIEHTEGVTTRAIRGIESILPQCAARSQLIHESGLCPWSKPAAKLNLRDYHHFTGPAK